MSSDPEDRSHEAEVARALDQLGAQAVAEAGEPPAVRVGRAPATRRGPLLAVAAVVVMVACGALAVLLTRTTDDESVVAAPNTSMAEPAPDGALRFPEDEVVWMSFSPDPAPTTGMLEVTITNNTEEPWSFDCLAGVLSRWDGEQMEPLGSTIWQDDQLLISDDIVEPACTVPATSLEPGATEVRRIRLDATLGDDGGPLVLEPGTYQLLFPNRMTFTGAFGQFELRSEPGTDSSTTSVADENRCDTPEGREAAALLGVGTPTPAMTGPADAASCSIDQGDLHVTYWYLDVQPEQFGTMQDGGVENLGLGDESFLIMSTSRSGRWTGQAGVRVGERAVWVEVRSDAGADTSPPVEEPLIEPTLRETSAAVATRLAAGLG